MPDNHFLRVRDDANVIEPPPEAPAAQGYVGTYADAPKAPPTALIVEPDASGNIVVRSTEPAPDAFVVTRDADGNVVVRGA